MKKIKIAILDSGVRKDHPAFSTKTINRFSLRLIDESVKQYAVSYPPLGSGRTIAGLNIHDAKGCPSNGWISATGIFRTSSDCEDLLCAFGMDSPP